LRVAINTGVANQTRIDWFDSDGCAVGKRPGKLVTERCGKSEIQEVKIGTANAG